MQANPTPFAKTYFHGTKAELKLGDLITVGYNSNYGQQKNAKYIFLTATLDAAIWGAELAIGEGKERIYLVEPTGPIEDDPDLTDKKFPGNPTKSYRSTHPFKVIGELNRVDFGLKYNSVLEAGGVALSEVVKIDCTIEITKAK